METSGPTVLAFVPGQHAHLIPYLAAIHASCITHDRAIATFLPPLSHEKLLSWWKDRIAEIGDDARLIYILVNELEPSGPDRGPRGVDVAGVVMLSMPRSETGSFRAVVEELLVHKNCRGQGVARTLMAALEEEALHRGRTLLTAEAETATPAEEVYKRLGFVEVGKVPQYAMSPSGELKDVTFFYKQLQQ